jgi:hypothetical protein
VSESRNFYIQAEKTRHLHFPPLDNLSTYSILERLKAWHEMVNVTQEIESCAQDHFETVLYKGT